MADWSLGLTQDVGSGSIASDRHARDARAMSAFTPIASKHWQRSETTRCASSGHSIPSLARNRIEGGSVMPRSFAVLRFATTRALRASWVCPLALRRVTPPAFVSWRALRVSNFAQTAAVQAGIVPLRGASNQEDVMKKMSMIGATLLGAAVLCAAPISLHQSQNKGLSLSLDSADARVGQPLSAGSVAGVHRRANRRAVRHGY